MKNNINADVALDIVGYAAKTEQIKAELLLCIAGLFKDCAMGNKRLLQEEQLAWAINLVLLLALRQGVSLETVARAIKMQAKNGLIQEDSLREDYKALLDFINGGVFL